MEARRWSSPVRPVTDDEVRNIVGEHLDRLEQHVAVALEDQDDDGSRAAFTPVQGGVRDHKGSLRQR